MEASFPSEPRPDAQKITPETIDLIRRMAMENKTWGAERIRDQLLEVRDGFLSRGSKRKAFGTSPLLSSSIPKPGERFRQRGAWAPRAFGRRRQLAGLAMQSVPKR